MLLQWTIGIFLLCFWLSYLAKLTTSVYLTWKMTFKKGKGMYGTTADLKPNTIHFVMCILSYVTYLFVKKIAIYVSIELVVLLLWQINAVSSTLLQAGLP